MFRLPAWTVEQLRAIVQIVGWETVEKARALGRGVLLCSAHLGQFEAGLQIVATNGVPVLAPAEHIQPERLYRFLADLRTRHGLRFIPSDGSMLEVFRALKRNEAVGLALDRDTTESGVDVTLCGKPAHVPDGYARIAAKTRTPLVTGFCYRSAGWPRTDRDASRCICQTRPPTVTRSIAPRSTLACGNWSAPLPRTPSNGC